MTPWVQSILPEAFLFLITCVVMVLGLSPRETWRRKVAGICGFGLIGAGLLAVVTPVAFPTFDIPNPRFPALMPFAKVAIVVVGFFMLLLIEGAVDREQEARFASGREPFNPGRSTRAEFYAFFLFSLTGAMLCASARDLAWLFLALELTSLPTYIMVTLSGVGRMGLERSREAGVKYFFLGALGAAFFLYGFALIYGGTGVTTFAALSDAFATRPINPISLIGIILAIVGIAFKIAAVPMHFYAADVYQGASAPVAAFLSFVPKTAGFLALIALLSPLGWGEGLPEAVRMLLWVMAAVTMTVGNVLAILQSSVKRILAYSSIAHSGYMIVGLIAGPGDGSFIRNGVAAVLFYLFAYGVTTIGTFAAVACIEDRDERGEPSEIDSIDRLRGLCWSRPWLGWTLVACSLSLLGFPPLVGFFAKVPLFAAGISAGEYSLVIILGLNSAIAGFYYLRFVVVALLTDPDPDAHPVRLQPDEPRRLAALVSLAGVLVLAVVGSSIMTLAAGAARFHPAVPSQAAAVEGSERPSALPQID